MIMASVLILSSCSDDENAPVDPAVRAPFLGSYQVKDQNSKESQLFSFTLNVKESDKGPDKIELKNFRYINSGLYATVSGNKFYIDQVLSDSNEHIEVKGEGTLTNDVLEYAYTIVVKKTGKETRIFENTAKATRVD